MQLNNLEIREVFHIEFLRKFSKTIEASKLVLKGGTNIRLFFKSIRYSEDMDIDIKETPVHVLKENVMSILTSGTFRKNLKPFGIDEVAPPDITKAKQTETVQRFKIHLITTSGENLFTKVEFSRRGFDKSIKAEAASPLILSKYKLPPLIVPHYLIDSVLKQKISALMNRKVTQPRDIFDLYMISTQFEADSLTALPHIGKDEFKHISQRIDQIDYKTYRDVVVSYLDIEDQKTCDSKEHWDEIRLVVLNLIERGLEKDA